MQNYFTPDIETASRDYLTAIQSARLIKMVENCYKHVPFYKQKFDEIGLLPGDIKSIADITKLPFTIKQDLRDNYPFGLFAVPKEKLVRVHASSGTTGKQTVVGYTKHDISIWSESAARALSAAGATKGDYIHISYATAFLRAASDFIMPQKSLVQLPFPYHPAILTDRCKFCRISVQTLFAVLRRMLCISANH